MTTYLFHGQFSMYLQYTVPTQLTSFSLLSHAQNRCRVRAKHTRRCQRLSTINLLVHFKKFLATTINACYTVVQEVLVADATVSQQLLLVVVVADYDYSSTTAVNSRDFVAVKTPL